MKKISLYILLLSSPTAVIADWLTIEHDLDICNLTVPGKYAAFHVNVDDGTTYSTSFMVQSLETLKNDTSFPTYNLTMWGCTFDCSFSFVVQLNKKDRSVSMVTDKNVKNYHCLASNDTQSIIPTPKISYNGHKPNGEYIFPPMLTLDYCRKGIHPDYPDSPFDPASNVHTCIDHLTGYVDGTYAANLHFGYGSSFSPDGWGVATYHLISSANKVFDHWDVHFRAFHDAFANLSNRMTPENFKTLNPPQKKHKRKIGLYIIAGIVAAGLVITCVSAAMIFGRSIAGAIAGEAIQVNDEGMLVNEVAARIEAIDGKIAAGKITPALGSTMQQDIIHDNEQLLRNMAAQWGFPDFANYPGHMTVQAFRLFYSNENVAKILSNLQGVKSAIHPEHLQEVPMRKREAEELDNIGFYTVTFVSKYFLPTVMADVVDSLSSDEKYPDLTTYLTGASENTQFHFNQSLYNNFFTANMSILNSFVGTQLLNNDELTSNDDEIYQILRDSAYNTIAASILTTVLYIHNLVICDPKPSFCGKGCDCAKSSCRGTYICPTIGKDQCVMNIQPSQIEGLEFFRDISDICSNNGTGWNITHHPDCDASLFECRTNGG